MLAEAVLEIADDMEEECRLMKASGDSIVSISTVRQFIKQLRRAVKAAEGTQQQGSSLSNIMAQLADPTTNAGFNRNMVEAAKLKLRAEGYKGSSEMVEEMEPIQREVVGTEKDGEPLCVPVDSRAPFGARMMVPEVGQCELKADGKLHPLG